jgi:uncharacterized protein YfeS
MWLYSQLKIKGKVVMNMKEFTVKMEHKMSSVQIVEAENEEQAKELAYIQAFNDDETGVWEEIDTVYVSIS